MKTKINLSGNY